MINKKGEMRSSITLNKLLICITILVATLLFSYTHSADAQATDTVLSLSVYLPGIGNSGDVLNATNTTLNTQKPTNTDKTVNIYIYNAANQLAATKTGTISFEGASGNFLGQIKIGATLNGAYVIKIQIPGYLKKRVPGSYRLVPGATVQMQPLTMIAGDFNGDNATNILDFNFLKGCYKDFLAPSFCDADKTAIADITGDGKVNILDYNLFIREIAVHTGD